MDEARLLEKLRAIEALFAGATTDGERVAAEYEELSGVLRRHLDEVTERIIAAAIHADVSDAKDAGSPGNAAPGLLKGS